MGASPKSEEAAQNARASIEIDIVVGRLYPRERLIEEHLSERFGLSRHVVRRVLADLEADGLVKRTPGRGAVVAEYSVDEVRQLYDMREFLEREAALRIPETVPEPALAEIRAILDEWTEAAMRQDLARIVETNTLFHQRIYALCGNQFLTASIDRHARRAKLVRFSTSTEPAFAERTLREHEAIVEALQEPDRARLATVCIDHIRPAAAHYIARRQKLEDFQDIS